MREFHVYLLTKISGLLRMLVVGEVVTGNEDRHGKAVLQRQADLVDTVPAATPKQRRVDGVMRGYSTHERKLRQG